MISEYFITNSGRLNRIFNNVCLRNDFRYTIFYIFSLFIYHVLREISSYISLAIYVLKNFMPIFFYRPDNEQIYSLVFVPQHVATLFCARHLTSFSPFHDVIIFTTMIIILLQYFNVFSLAIIIFSISRSYVLWHFSNSFNEVFHII